MTIYILWTILIISFAFFVNSNRVTFIPVTFSIISLNPIIEKLSDPTLQGKTWSNIDLARVWPEYILTLYLFLLLNKIKIKKQDLKGNYLFLIALWFLFTFFSVIFSKDVTRSLYIFPIVFVNPILCYILVVAIYSEHKNNIQLLINQVTLGVFIFNMIGIILFFIFGGIEDLLISDYDMIRKKTGLWLGNHGIQCVSIFAPIILLSNNKIIKNLTFLMICMSLFIGSSRTNMLIGFLLVSFYFLNNLRKIITIKIFIRSLILFFIFSQTILVKILPYITSYNDFIFNRFVGNGDLLDDERTFIWANAISISSDNQLFGIGLGNFIKYSSENFSDAHNIFLSILVESGIINFFIFSILITLLLLQKNKNKYHKYLKLGLLLFIINGMTGNQLYNNSGFVTGMMAFFFFTFLGYNKILNSK